MREGPSSRARERLWQRLPSVLLYGLLGALVGLIGSFTHRARFDVASIEVWYGIFVALACVTAFAIGLRRAARDRAVGVAYAIGVVAAIAFLAAGFSNSVVIVGDLVGMLWLGLAPLIVFGVAFWPRLPARRDNQRAAGSAETTSLASTPAAPGSVPQADGYAGSQDPATPIPPKESQP